MCSLCHKTTIWTNLSEERSCSFITIYSNFVSKEVYPSFLAPYSIAKHCGSTYCSFLSLTYQLISTFKEICIIVVFLSPGYFTQNDFSSSYMHCLQISLFIYSFQWKSNTPLCITISFYIYLYRITSRLFPVSECLSKVAVKVAEHVSLMQDGIAIIYTYIYNARV